MTKKERSKLETALEEYHQSKNGKILAQCVKEVLSGDIKKHPTEIDDSESFSYKSKMEERRKRIIRRVGNYSRE